MHLIHLCIPDELSLDYQSGSGGESASCNYLYLKSECRLNSRRRLLLSLCIKGNHICDSSLWYLTSGVGFAITVTRETSGNILTSLLLHFILHWIPQNKYS